MSNTGKVATNATNDTETKTLYDVFNVVRKKYGSQCPKSSELTICVDFGKEEPFNFILQYDANKKTKNEKIIIFDSLAGEHKREWSAIVVFNHQKQKTVQNDYYTTIERYSTTYPKVMEFRELLINLCEKLGYQQIIDNNGEIKI